MPASKHIELLSDTVHNHSEPLSDTGHTGDLGEPPHSVPTAQLAVGSGESEEAAVVLSFARPGSLTLRQRTRIARWLQQKAQDLEDYGNLWGAHHTVTFPDNGKWEG